MPSDTVVLAFNHFGESLKYALRLLTQRMTALVHRYTYRASESPRHVVVIGGSYAGLYLAFRLAESLPIGWKVILVEQNSHFNHTFNFPRYSVLQGHEQNAFVPYAGLFSNIPQGVFEQVHNRAVGIEDGLVELASGESIQYEYLAIATGATQSPPSKLLSLEKGDACGEMKALQDKIKEAKTIALVGGGPVGVQLATDIRAFYPEKDITLVHSRAHLLNNFGVRLHDYVMEKLRKSGVKVVLKERPVLPKTVPWEDAKMMFKDGSKHDFDLVIPCTGQSPNSSLLEHFSPSSISGQTGRILVEPTLIISSDQKSDINIGNVFALGDVAETGGAKMARAGGFQAEIVRQNILALIQGKKSVEYKPLALEGSIKLSLGKDECVMYMQDESRDYLIPGKLGSVDLEVAKTWKMFGADMKNAATL